MVVMCDRPVKRWNRRALHSVVCRRQVVRRVEPGRLWTMSDRLGQWTYFEGSMSNITPGLARGIDHLNDPRLNKLLRNLMDLQEEWCCFLDVTREGYYWVTVGERSVASPLPGHPIRDVIITRRVTPLWDTRCATPHFFVSSSSGQFSSSRVTTRWETRKNDEEIMRVVFLDCSQKNPL
ncbi:hypothetical protein AAG570_006433 [Ranatra chinensis]|uniref:Uncharacterized protein n=1 Tax=Ranatra chinensis TaxID=642074 RepID=A0ABD0YTZ5_9HEMI